ncbi:hypothetical protein NUM3379_42700 [Kineococcus sp. NUM-3379]
MTLPAPPRTLVPDLAVLSVALVWGCSFVAVQQVAAGASVALVLALRFGLAVLLLLPVVLLAARASGRVGGPGTAGSWAGALRRGVLPGLMLLAIFTLETHGAVRTTPARAGVLVALFAVVVPFAAALRERRSPRWGAVGAGAVAVGGVALLLGPGGGVREGDLLLLAAAAVRGVVTALDGDREDPDPLRSTVVRLGVVAAGSLAVALAVPGAAAGGLPQGAAAWWALLFLAGPCTAFALLVQRLASRRTSPERVAVLFVTEPVWAALAGVAAGDRLSPVQVVGVVLVLVAQAALRVPWRRAPARSAGPDEPRAVGQDDGLRPVPGARLGQDGRDVAAHRLQPHTELGRDLGVAQPGGDQPQHLLLPGGEPGQLRDLRRGPAHVAAGELAHGVGEQQRLPAGDRADPVQHLLR